VLHRHADWFSYLGVDPARREAARPMMDQTLALSQGMMHQLDIEALAAALFHCQPRRIFEIGTYRGASSDMMLRLLPEARVISIAFASPEKGKRQFNNDQLPVEDVGSLVSPENRGRFTQLIGDSHRIDPVDFVRDHGQMDMVFIDGDHSWDGVRQDTDLARAILAPGGAIIWHDANPKRRYVDTRRFLEEDLRELALATSDDFIGGVALWTEILEQRLRSEAVASRG
jgi:predicted O-methyltransferase YrrM